MRKKTAIPIAHIPAGSAGKPAKPINGSLSISILSFLLSFASFCLVGEQNHYTNLFLPFTYSAVRKEPSTLHYTIGENLELPAYETIFHVETGACSAFYIIGYNGVMRRPSLPAPH